MVGYEGDQGNMPGPLYGNAQGSLVLGANTGPTPWLDLGPVGHKPSYLFNVLVVN